MTSPTLALYRRWRPQTFAELVGQDPIVAALTGAVTSGNPHHAYLFSGPRGTGKTSTARILAKALNCAEDDPAARPCNSCDSCTQITAQSSFDVIELDAASNGGVDDVRDLREKLNLAPAQARRKVYIVDECHMLSTQGWNAFLKAVEEPPPHVLFVFATTEAHKVPATILSRTQRLEFRLVPSEVLADHVERIAAAEGFEFTCSEARTQLVRAGEGSVRDTLSVLDRVVAFTGPTISLDGVAAALGMVSADVVDRILSAVAAQDATATVTALTAAADAGVDLGQLTVELTATLREVLLTSLTPSDAPSDRLVDTTADRAVTLGTLAAAFTRSRLLRTVDLLADASERMRRGRARIPLELALVKAATPQATDDPAALVERIVALETQLAALTAPATGSVTAPVTTPIAPAASDADEVSVLPAASTASGLAADVVANWETVLTELRTRDRRLHALVKVATPEGAADETVALRFDDSHGFHAEQVAAALPQLTELVAAALDTTVNFEVATAA